MLDLGMTRQQIVENVYDRTGHRVTVNAVSMACKRAGIPPRGRRYPEFLPWRVRAVHEGHYAQAMLRLAGRRQEGTPLSKDETARLDSWLAKLERYRAVVQYDPDSADGFTYEKREPGEFGIVRRA